MALRDQPFTAFAGERLLGGAQFGQGIVAEGREDGADELAAKIGHKSAQRGNHSRPPRCHHARHAQFPRQKSPEHRSAAAEGHQREVAQVHAGARGKLFDLDEHLRNCDVQDCLCRFLQRPPQPRRQLSRLPCVRKLQVHAKLAIGHFAVAEPAADGHCIGDRGFPSAAPIARRPGIRAGRVRAHPQDTLRIDSWRSTHRRCRSN